VDVIVVGLSRAKALSNAGYVVHQKKDGLYVGLMWLRVWDPEFPTTKKKVRQALIYAINKNDIVEQILLGRGKVVGTATSMFTWSIEYKPYPPTPYDPEKTKKLLREAGYPNGFDIDIYSFVTKLPETKLINEAIAAYWESMGINVKILEMDFSVFKTYWTKQHKPKNPTAFILAWPNRPVYSWRNMYHSTALYSHYRDPVIDKLIEEFETQTTTEGYKAGGQKIMDHVLDNFYASGICTTHELYALGEGVPRWEMGKGVGSYRWEYMGKD
jgi:peptide/nickel transport system substrate-binding protein